MSTIRCLLQMTFIQCLKKHDAQPTKIYTEETKVANSCVEEAKKRRNYEDSKDSESKGPSNHNKREKTAFGARQATSGPNPAIPVASVPPSTKHPMSISDEQHPLNTTQVIYNPNLAL